MPLVTSPVQEVAFTVQTGPMGANLLDVAALAARFPDHPHIQHADPAPQLTLAPVSLPSFVPATALPRVWLIAEDGKSLIQFQDDRVSLNWRRLAPADEPAEYPGYEALAAHFAEVLAETRRWAQDRTLARPAGQVGELLYQNAVPLSDEPRRRMSDVLTFYKPFKPLPVNAFQTSWVEPLAGELQGFASVQASLGLTATGGTAVIVLITIRFTIADLTDAELMEKFDLAHKKVHEVLPYVFTQDILNSCR